MLGFVVYERYVLFLRWIVLKNGQNDKAKNFTMYVYIYKRRDARLYEASHNFYELNTS